ncbi:putative protein kinase regulator ILITHYIA [Wolffia australiana]
MDSETEEALRAISSEVSTSSTKQRIHIFRNKLPSILRNSEVSPDLASLIADIIFKTLPIYDDRQSIKAVDDLIVAVLAESPFMKSFAALLVLSVEKQVKAYSSVGSYKLLRWSCLLLKCSQFTSASKSAFSRLATAQASLLQLLLQGSFRLGRSCRKLLFHLFSKYPGLYRMYVEEMKDSRVLYNNAAGLIYMILEFSTVSISFFEQYKEIFLDVYLKAILNAKEQPSQLLISAFHPLLGHLVQEDFRDFILPTALKMLKRNPELVLESVVDLLKTTNLDLSKYALELLAVVLAQVRHADERRRSQALVVVSCLAQKSCDPDVLISMFNAIKAVILGSEGKLAVPFQRVGVFSSIQELSNAPVVKQLNRLGPTISEFLLHHYKSEGNEEVKLIILSALASWGAKAVQTIQPDVVSFFAAGLKEKDALRRGHLRCLRFVCRNSDTLPNLSSLVEALVQLVKTGFTKIAQRLDGLYALFPLAKILTVDVRAEELMTKDKVWSSISQCESPLSSLSMAMKLGNEDCITCVEILEMLLVDHPQRLDATSVRSMLQVMLYFICHPSWEVRKMAQGSATKILSGSSYWTEIILEEYTDLLTVVGEENYSLKISDAENLGEAQAQFLPPPVLLVKCMLLIAPAALTHGTWNCGKLIFCSHHPSISSIGQSNAVWKRLRRNLHKHGFAIIEIVSENMPVICEELFGARGLMSSNSLNRETAVRAFSTLMSVNPSHTFTEFKKHMERLPDWCLHRDLSENDIKIFNTPEGMVSSEQGVYIAESVASKNVRLAKGRFRLYDNDDSPGNRPTVSTPKETIKKEGVTPGKKVTGRVVSTKIQKDKVKTSKEEARDLLLREEAIVRDKVMGIRRNLSVVCRALGAMAVANPVYAHTQLPLLVKFVDPLLRSPIISDAAFETLLKLVRCLAPPLGDWAPEIAAALRIISMKEAGVVPLDSILVLTGGENDLNLSLFEQILSGLLASSRSGPLPADSFTVVFPILEKILMSSGKTSLHDNVLQVLSLHMDPVLPLPRMRMLSALYHVLSVVPAYQLKVGPMLNELCLGLRADDVGQALQGVYARDVHVRLACLSAVKCIPCVSSRSIPQNAEIATNLWISLHDPEKVVAEAAEDIWDNYGFDFGADYTGLYLALSHVNQNVRLAAAEALAAALDENLDSIQEALSTLFTMYIQFSPSGKEIGDASWLGRQGIAMALQSAADVLRTKDLPVVMTFLISRAVGDPNVDVRGRMINAGITIIDRHGKENVSLLFPIFENYLNKKASSNEEKYDLIREGVVIFTGALAKHLAKDDPKVHDVVEKLMDVLNTPSESVQRAVSLCLSPLMVAEQDKGQEIVHRLVERLMKSDKYGERRGAAFGLAGVVKGFGIRCLKNYGIVAILQEGLEDRISAKSREGALLAFECLCEKLGRLFEPYVIQYLPFLLASFSDQVGAVREAAEGAARAMMSQLSGSGVKLILPSLLKGLEDKAWRTKQSSVQLLGAMAFCAPQQLSQCLPKIVPKLTEVLTDTHPKVQSAGQTALQQVGSVIKNPEISALVPTLLLGLTDPNDHTKHSLDILLQTTFINSVDAPSLALVVPIVHRGLRERSVDTKKKAAQITGNMCSLVTEPLDMIPYINLLLPEVKKVLVDPIPEVRSVAARAIGSLIRGMGEENFPDLVQWLLDTLKSDSSNVERSGAAQGLSEVLAALGTAYFERLLPDILRNCSHQRASVRDGYLTLFKFLPRSLGPTFQNYLQQVLPAILDGLADENESVRDAALCAGHVFVEHYARTSLPLLLPAIEDGIFNDNWRIRQSSVELLGDLLFKIAGTSGKALLEGGSDDEGSSTEAHGRAIIEVLGRNKRNEVLAAIYMIRSDVSLSVRQAALHVWKTIVANTPKTLKEILPVLMDTLILSLASPSSERRQVAGRSLGELVRKLGERVLPLIIPILSRGLRDSDASRRQGVCFGLSEVMASAGKNQLIGFMSDLIPTIRVALCDSSPEVREAAGLAFSTLYKSAGLQAIDEIVPTLLHALEDEDASHTALDGLKQILSVRTAAVLPHILPKLVNPPLSAFNAHALGALAEVAGPALNFHLGTVLPALVLAMSDDDEKVQHLAKNAAETVVLVIDDEGISSLMSELLKGVSDNQPLTRRGYSYLIGHLFKNSKLDLLDEASNMISTLIPLLSDNDQATVQASWEALGRVIGSVPKEILPSYIKLVRDAISTARDKERRKRKGGSVLIPGLCLPRALQPLLPIFLQGIISGSAETRELAAQGLGELVDVTGEKTLREFVVPITGPLIRTIGDRFPWQVKGAILSTLSIIISKGGILLKPFLPQLQTTFIKCLQDSARSVRSSSAVALSKLSALSTRIDPLVTDLLSALQASDVGVQGAVLAALKGVITYAGKSITGSVKHRTCTVMKEFIELDDEELRSSAAKALGAISKYLEEHEVTEMVESLISLSTSSNWSLRHGSILTLAAMSSNNPSMMCMSTSFPSAINRLKAAIKDDKFPVREVATRAVGSLLLFLVQSEKLAVGYSELLQFLAWAMQDETSEVKRRSLACLKAISKVNPSAVLNSLPLLGPAIAECLKDANTPVRLAAERCALHAFQLTKGPERVQAAQKYITGLESRRLSKLQENSDDSDEEKPSG